MHREPSPNQQKCYIHWEPFAIVYSKDIPRNALEAAIEIIDVIEVLRPVFEPTSADLQLGCAEKESRKKDTNQDPSKTRWRIRSSDLPEEIKRRRKYDYEEDNSSPDFKAVTLSQNRLPRKLIRIQAVRPSKRWAATDSGGVRGRKTQWIEQTT